MDAGKAAVSRGKLNFGLLAELADAMDSKSIDTPPESPNETANQAHPARVLEQRLNADPDAAALVALLPRLSAKQVRQLVALARSMAE